MLNKHLRGKPLCGKDFRSVGPVTGLGARKGQIRVDKQMPRVPLFWLLKKDLKRS